MNDSRTSEKKAAAVAAEAPPNKLGTQARPKNSSTRRKTTERGSNFQEKSDQESHSIPRRAHSPVFNSNRTMVENEDSKLPAGPTQREETAPMPSNNSAGREVSSNTGHIQTLNRAIIAKGNNGTNIMDSQSEEESELKPPAVPRPIAKTNKRIGRGQSACKREQIKVMTKQRGASSHSMSPRPGATAVSGSAGMSQMKQDIIAKQHAAPLSSLDSRPGTIAVSGGNLSQMDQEVMAKQRGASSHSMSSSPGATAVSGSAGMNQMEQDIITKQCAAPLSSLASRPGTIAVSGGDLSRMEKKVMANQRGASSYSMSSRPAGATAVSGSVGMSQMEQDVMARSPVMPSSLPVCPLSSASPAKISMVDASTTTPCRFSLPGDNWVVSTTAISSRARSRLPVTISTTARRADSSNPHPAPTSTPTPAGPLPPISHSTLKGGGTRTAPNQPQQPGTTYRQNIAATAEIPGAYQERARAIGDIPVWDRQDNNAPTARPTAQEPMEQPVPGANSTAAVEMGARQEAAYRETSGANIGPPGNPNGNRLVEARMISESNLQAELTQAEEVDLAEAERKSIELKRQNNRFLWRIGCTAILALVCIVEGVTLGLILASSWGKSEPTHFPTVAPSLLPSERPSSAPTGGLDLLLQDLPEHTHQNLKNFSTPQWKAHDWLSFHPDLPSMEEWRKKQLFALATFFYAMEGPSWPKPIKDNWLQYTDECHWFTTVFGEFDSRTGKWVESNYYNLTLQSNCNRQDEFEFLDLVELGLTGYKPFVPPEIDLLTSLSILTLFRNEINSSIAEFIPPQLYQMSSLRTLGLSENALSGPIPTELGLLTNMTQLWLYNNSFSGSIPSEVGMMTSMVDLTLVENALTGSIPTELGLMTNMAELWLSNNTLAGPIPSELGLLTGLLFLQMENNALSGTIPNDLVSLTSNVSVQTLALANNSLSGVVPQSLCSIGLFEISFWSGLSFDCSGQLCGCCWCSCPGSNLSNTECQTNPYDPSEDDVEWPGTFPTSSNTITINVRTDDYPEETTLEWYLHRGPTYWELLDSHSPEDASSVHSYTEWVESESLYRLQLFDRWEDGTCCAGGLGWFTITDSTPSQAFVNGTVAWKATGHALESSLDVYLWIDAEGHAHQVEHLPGQGYALIQEESETGKKSNIVLADAFSNTAGGGEVVDESLTP